MPRRKKAIVILTLPIVLLLCLIGLAFFYLGSKQKPIDPKVPKREKPSLIALTQEQETNLKTRSNR
jgi:flagellar basal body-associated protein FliL